MPDEQVLEQPLQAPIQSGGESAYGKKEPSQARKAIVKKWIDRIKDSKKKWEPDFKRMRSNMDFAAGFQWESQAVLDDEKYVANITLRNLNQKVSQLYARNPKATANRRPRLDFQLWDEEPESLVAAMQSLMANPLDMQSRAVLMDYQHGMDVRKQIDKIGRTLEVCYDWNIRKQTPGFKKQMKQLVRRAVTAGVGFVRLSFSRDYDSPLADNENTTAMIDRMKAAKSLVAEMHENDVDEDDNRWETLRQLINSVGVSVEQGDSQDVNERLVFDFPPATSVIIDKKCRCLQGFVGARWVAQEYILPLSTVKAFFEKPDLKLKKSEDEGVKEYVASGEEKDLVNGEVSEDCKEPNVCVWELFDKVTKSVSFLCDGYCDYLQEPEAPEQIENFWPIFALTLNDIETEEGNKSSIYPPSDVQLMKHAQKEWNKSREELKHHRNANRPMYAGAKGTLSDEDKQKIAEHTPSEYVELQNVPPGTDINKVVQRFQHEPIDPSLYNTAQSQQDILMAVGAQSADLGPLTGASATEATISEQSKMSTTSSNVDDLDMLLSEMAMAAGEIMLRNLSLESVKKMAGDGAVWPQDEREAYIDQIFLDIKAASSGRPNKALDVATFERIAPMLVQAGANPMFIVEEGIKRLDDQLDMQKAFPLVPPQMGAAMSAPKAGTSQAGSGKVRGQEQQQPGQQAAPQGGVVV